MKPRRLHVERLLGRVVHDVDGRRVGRVEEIQVQKSGNGYVVTEYVLGTEGLLKRLSFRGIGLLFIPSLADKPQRRGKVVPWQQMELTNPKRPRLRCRKDDL